MAFHAPQILNTCSQNTAQEEISVLATIPTHVPSSSRDAVLKNASNVPKKLPEKSLFKSPTPVAPVERSPSQLPSRPRGVSLCTSNRESISQLEEFVGGLLSGTSSGSQRHARSLPRSAVHEAVTHVVTEDITAAMVEAKQDIPDAVGAVIERFPQGEADALSNMEAALSTDRRSQASSERVGHSRDGSTVGHRSISSNSTGGSMAPSRSEELTALVAGIVISSPELSEGSRDSTIPPMKSAESMDEGEHAAARGYAG